MTLSNRYFPTFSKGGRHFLGAGGWLSVAIPRAFLVGLVLFVLAAIPWTYFNIKWGRQVEAQLAALKAEGKPVTMLEAVPKPVPEDQNAAVVYQEVFQCRLGRLTPDERKKLLPKSPLAELNKKVTHDKERIVLVLDAQTRAALRSPEAQRILETLRRGSERPYSVFPVNWEAGFPGWFSLASMCPTAARVLGAHSRILAEAGRVDEALDWCLVSLRMSQQVASEGHLIAQLVTYAMQSITFDALRDIVSPEAIRPALAREFEELLCRIELYELFDASMDVQRALVCDTYELLRRELDEVYSPLDVPKGLPACLYFGWPGRPLHKLDQLIYLEYAERHEKLVDQPYRDSAADFDALQAELSRPVGLLEAPATGIVFRMVAPRFSKAVQKRDWAGTQIDLCRVVMALKAYKYTHQAYPATLDQLQETLDYRLPEDPFSGKGFVYQPQGEGFKLYSLGVDLDDDGGATLEDEGHDYDNCDIVWECVS